MLQGYEILEDKDFTLALLSSILHKENGWAILFDLGKKDPDKITRWLYGVLRLYLQDKNSSLIREYATYSILKQYYEEKENVWQAHYIGSKHDYDAKVKARTGRVELFFEIKPVNVGDRKLRLSDLKISISDYTPSRFQSDLSRGLELSSEKKSLLLYTISGFKNDQLVYVVQVPFFCVADSLLEELAKAIGGKELVKEPASELRKRIESLKLPPEDWEWRDEEKVEAFLQENQNILSEFKDLANEAAEKLKNAWKKNKYVRAARVSGGVISKCPFGQKLLDRTSEFEKEITNGLAKALEKLKGLPTTPQGGQK